MAGGTFSGGNETGTGKQGKAQYQGTSNMHYPERPGFQRRNIQGVQVKCGIGDGQRYHEFQQSPLKQPAIGLNRLLVHIVGEHMVFTSDHPGGCLMSWIFGVLFCGHDKPCLQENRGR